MLGAFRAGASLFVLLLAFGACSTTTEGTATGIPSPECRTDADCASSNVSCRRVQCVEQKCQESDVPAGVTAQEFLADEPACKRVVCDGHGGEQSVPDPTSIPTGNASACMRVSCDAAGNETTVPDLSRPPTDTPHDCEKETCSANGTVILVPDPSDTPVDTPNDCHQASCSANGTVTPVPDPNDLPLDQRGDCQKNTCNADGTIGTTADDTDTPPPSTCQTFTCTSGKPVGTAANIGTVCSSLGFACGTSGQCDTCPAPNAACSEPGIGSRSSSAPYDFQGIGHCDSGGRSFCGAVPTGAADYATYYDDGTGPLCSFDPYFEILPSAPVTFCAYFDCPSVACPSGSHADTSAAGKPGCCLNAAAGAFTGMQIGFCSGARVTTKVTTGASCAGYELHFHD